MIGAAKYPITPVTSFSSKVVVNGEIKTVTSNEISKNYNRDGFYAIDGEIIRACDHLAACVETYISHLIRNIYPNSCRRQPFVI